MTEEQIKKAAEQYRIHSHLWNTSDDSICLEEGFTAGIKYALSRPRTIKVNLEGFRIQGDEIWLSELPEFPGMAESGKTQLEAFEELMISLKVKIAYDNSVNLKQN